MKKNICAISDVHGCCAATKKALSDAGFIPNDDGWLLVVCGDCFDRGEENREFFDFLNGIRNKIIIRGNHEDMLGQILEKRHIGPAGFSNGMDTTVRSFFGERAFGDLDTLYGFAYKLDFRGRESTVEELRNFLANTYDYFETEHYIFTHGWLPLGFDEDGSCFVKEDFRYDLPSSWNRARFTEWYRTYGAGAVVKGKTIVCGHRTARFACLFDPARDQSDSSVFLADGLAVIDGSAVRTGKVNVLVIEDEPMYESEHEMSLATDPFKRIQSGKKRVELRLLDEKRKKIRVGDRIVFKHTENPSETLRARVIGLHGYPNFDALSADFFRSEMGFEDRRESVGEIMRAYYSDEEVKEHGVLAIRIMLEQ